MGFMVTTLIFVVIGIIASLCTRICCNRGPSAKFVCFFCLILDFWIICFLVNVFGLSVWVIVDGSS
ncbi:hypothetical protein Patl1_04089 [Pistacia atlantica]|uniref:Uncharacterized protein n=1 Tax=Pistacia atlantica TaxID=434234 RepID=A0ACC1BQ06_9ROSI|nr:hypothetical protein Patl1_04089 [Pistacia atlantica]